MDTPTRFHADRILTTKHSSQTNPIHAHFIFHVPLKQFTSNTFQIKDWISRPFFEGYFEWQHEEYSVTSIPTYQLQKRDVDIHVPDPQHRLHPQAQLSQLMVYRTLKDRAMTFTNTTPTHFHCGTNTENTRITMLEDPPPHLFHLDSFHTISNLTSPSLKKRQGNRGCPTSKKILYMGIALDCTYVKLRGGATLARTQVLRNFLKISALYENTFNIQIGITEIQLFESCNTPLFNRPCDPSITMLRRLSEFSQWRSSISKDAGLWHLFSECNQGSTVGLAWTGVLCRTDANLNVDMAGSEAYVSGTGVSAPGSKFATDAEWLISAHEIGHNFGARHDCTSQSDCSASNCCGCTESLCNKCDRSYLMNPTSDGASAIFSPCSQKDICTKNQVSGACLQEPGQRKMITIAQCGNGIVEDGEECDCGGNMCPNACCGLDCKLKSNAVCDDASHACCKNCQLASTGTVCRSATGPCDYTEYCNGTSKYCPPDIFLPNGEACSISTNSSGTCTSGQCTTRDFQCILQTIGSFDGYNEITGAWYVC
ncbi:hypothetical protein HMI55_000696 [Coelomomyces lativittatus]|nr:hypothetical protein HMI56_003171 [Coelomomyces lativittatus]KAJ1507637.1 hypothetical protein HMI55_000696 [Coelomomyces lativittatus]